MNPEQARYNMVEQQIRPWEVLDEGVLGLLFEVKREGFVPSRHRRLAFADLEIPLGHGAAMWEPKLEARVLQTLAVQPDETVLEVGTGSGYLTALLARRANHVYSVELVADLSRTAGEHLAEAGIANATLEVGDAARGWTAHAPYDVIVLTGSVPELPEAWLSALRPGGRLFAVVGREPAMTARLYTCEEAGVCRAEDLFEVVVPPLVNAPEPSRFVF